MSSTPIPFATIGTGWITASFIASAHHTKQWDLRALYSRSPETAQSFLSKNNITSPSNSEITVHTTLDALATDPNVSVIYIASPNSLHHAHAAQMLRRGKHVILEKPLAQNAKEVDELFSIAKEHNVYLLEAYRHLHERNFLAIKSIVQEGLKGQGLLGRILSAKLEYAQFSSKVPALQASERDTTGQTPVPNIFNLEFGGGALVDLGVYCVAAAVDLFGAPGKWHYDPVMLSTGADGAGFLTLNYGKEREKAFNVLCHHSKLYDGKTAQSCAVYGEKGTLLFSSITDIQSVMFAAHGKEEPREVGVDHPFSGGEKGNLNLSLEAREFARIVVEKDERAVKRLEQVSRDVVRITEGARRDTGILFPGEK